MQHNVASQVQVFSFGPGHLGNLAQGTYIIGLLNLGSRAGEVAIALLHGLTVSILLHNVACRVHAFYCGPGPLGHWAQCAYLVGMLAPESLCGEVAHAMLPRGRTFSFA